MVDTFSMMQAFCESSFRVAEVKLFHPGHVRGEWRPEAKISINCYPSLSDTPTASSSRLLSLANIRASGYGSILYLLSREFTRAGAQYEVSTRPVRATYLKVTYSRASSPTSPDCILSAASKSWQARHPGQQRLGL